MLAGIELATISGQLGYAAKTATRANHSPGRPAKFVLYVQWDGERKEVASALKGLGFSNLRFNATAGRGGAKATSRFGAFDPPLGLPRRGERTRLLAPK